MQSDMDLARGLDFGRTNMNNLGPVWARATHLNHEAFSYRIVVRLFASTLVLDAFFSLTY